MNGLRENMHMAFIIHKTPYTKVKPMRENFKITIYQKFYTLALTSSDPGTGIPQVCEVSISMGSIVDTHTPYVNL